ncbi:hypothetical protein [Streptomyces sp. NBC_01477]|uniref:hypothetical protein n=1 Tax=Streptomyces sp. NBC_01477 TaxID=2976015 RepID=UPI002E33F7AF|nr:hypothetical protein [Streptomyces sp. NBC_01477]
MGILVPVLGLVVTLIVRGGGDSSAQPPLPTTPTAAPPSSTASAPSAGTELPAPSDPPATASPTGEAPPAAPDGYVLQRTDWGVAPANCSDHEARFTSLATGRSVLGHVGEDGKATAPIPPNTQLEYYAGSCTGSVDYVLTEVSGTSVGVLRVDRPKTLAACRAAANQPFGKVQLVLNDPDRTGIRKGAAFCTVLSDGDVGMGVIDNVDQESVGGTLYVWHRQ